VADKFKEEIAGKFYTIEDLMDPSTVHPVDPADSSEVSGERPIRLWMPPDLLASILANHLYVMRECQRGAAPANQRQWERAILQVRLWLRHLEGVYPRCVHVVMYPGSGSDLTDDSEAAIKA